MTQTTVRCREGLAYVLGGIFMTLEIVGLVTSQRQLLKAG